MFLFWTKFAKKGYFCSKTEKVNIVIQFWNFELVLVQNSSLNWQFKFLYLDLFEYAEFNDDVHSFRFRPEISYLFVKIVSLNWNLVPRLILMCIIQWWRSLLPVFSGNILFQIYPKYVFRLKTGKVNITIEFFIFELI